MDVDEYLRRTKECMRECSEQMGAKGIDVNGIQSIMGDGIICGIAGVDSAGNAITPYINYLDSRTAKDVQKINAMDLDIWGRETGNAEANCMFPAMFARWVLKNSKAFQEKGAKFIHNAPYMFIQRSGRRRSWSFWIWMSNICRKLSGHGILSAV